MEVFACVSILGSWQVALNDVAQIGFNEHWVEFLLTTFSGFLNTDKLVSEINWTHPNGSHDNFFTTSFTWLGFSKFLE